MKPLGSGGGAVMGQRCDVEICREMVKMLLSIYLD